MVLPFCPETVGIQKIMFEKTRVCRFIKTVLVSTERVSPPVRAVESRPEFHFNFSIL